MRRKVDAIKLVQSHFGPPRQSFCLYISSYLRKLILSIYYCIPSLINQFPHITQFPYYLLQTYFSVHCMFSLISQIPPLSILYSLSLSPVNILSLYFSYFHLLLQLLFSHSDDLFSIFQYYILFMKYQFTKVYFVIYNI